MKGLLKKTMDLLTDAALLEMGVRVTLPIEKDRTTHETIEENLIEVAFAEAAEYDDLHKAIQREHRAVRDIARPDDCQQGDNEICFRHAA